MTLRFCCLVALSYSKTVALRLFFSLVCAHNIGQMTRDDIRLNNLRKLVAEFRTIAALAEAAKTNEKYISQILNRVLLPSGKARQVGTAVARKLEAAALKDIGWMDYDHDNGGLIVTNANLTPDEAEMLRLFKRASEEKRRVLLAVGRL